MKKKKTHVWTKREKYGNTQKGAGSYGLKPTQRKGKGCSLEGRVRRHVSGSRTHRGFIK